MGYKNCADVADVSATTSETLVPQPPFPATEPLGAAIFFAFLGFFVIFLDI
jgi:hypothetical protein